MGSVDIDHHCASDIVEGSVHGEIGAGGSVVEEAVAILGCLFEVQAAVGCLAAENVLHVWLTSGGL